MKEKSRTEYSLLNIFVGLGGYFLNTALGFFCRIVFVKCLSADYLGVNGLFTNIISMLSLAELGVGSAIVYALYKPLAKHDDEKVAALMQLYGKAYRYIGFTVFIIGILLMPFLNLIITRPPDIGENIYLLYIINLINTSSTYLFSYKSSLLIAGQQNYIVSGLNYLITISQSLIQMIWLPLTHNYMGYLLIQTVGTFIFNLSVAKISDKRYPFIINGSSQQLSKEETTKIFKNVKDLVVYKISGLLVNSTDNILITFFKGLATTGIASNYTMLVTTLTTLLNQIFNSLTASIGNHNAESSRKDKIRMFNFMNFMNFWIFGWGALGIVFCASDLVQLCFGQEYVLPPQIPLIMAVNFYSVGMMNAVWTYKHTLGLFHYGRYLQILTGILNILFSIVLGYLWGILGIFLATFIARMLTNLWYDPYAVFKYGFHYPLRNYIRKYIRYLAVLAVTGLLCFFSMQIIVGDIFFKVTMKIIICSMIVNISFVLFLYKTNEFNKTISILKNSFVIISSWGKKRFKER